MYICIYIHIHVYLFIFVYTLIRTWRDFSCVHIISFLFNMYVYMYEYIYIDICIYIYICIHMFIYICIYMWRTHRNMARFAYVQAPGSKFVFVQAPGLTEYCLCKYIFMYIYMQHTQQNSARFVYVQAAGSTRQEGFRYKFWKLSFLLNHIYKIPVEIAFEKFSAQKEGLTWKFSKKISNVIWPLNLSRK